MVLNLEAAYNSLSFGNISYGVTSELFSSEIFPCIFPIAGNQDLSAFDCAGDEFKLHLNACGVKALKKFKKNSPSLKIWHIDGSFARLSEPSYLLTFHETDTITDQEANVLSNFNGVYVTSEMTKALMLEKGINANKVNIGFDKSHFHEIKQPRPYPNDVICWGLFGKFERRKWTAKTVQSWVKLFSNNPKHVLHLHVTNPFANPEQMNAMFAQAFENKPKPENVKIFGFVPTNSEMNKCYNAIDIVLDMSGGESLSLPSLTCVGIGKHAVIHNCSAMSDWANAENATLVEPCGKIPVYDNVFFFQGRPFSQGNIFEWAFQDFEKACGLAIDRFKKNPKNTAGLSVQKDYSYEVGVKQIINNIDSK